MKATIRKNGQMMFTTTVKFHFGYEDLVESLMNLQGYEEYDKEKGEVKLKPFYKSTKKEIIDNLKNLFHWYGSEIDTGLSDDDDFITAFLEKSKERINQLFPELKNEG